MYSPSVFPIMSPSSVIINILSDLYNKESTHSTIIASMMMMYLSDLNCRLLIVFCIYIFKFFHIILSINLKIVLHVNWWNVASLLDAFMVQGRYYRKSISIWKAIMTSILRSFELSSVNWMNGGCMMDGNIIRNFLRCIFIVFMF